MKIVSVARLTPGASEYPIFLEMLNYDQYLYNFDDRNYGAFNTKVDLFLRIFTKIVRNHLRKLFNKELKKYLQLCKPNLLFIYKGALIDPDTILEAKKLGIFVVFFYPDLDPNVHGRNYVKALNLSNILCHTKPNLKSLFLKINKSSIFKYHLITKRFINKIENPEENLGVLLVANYSEGKKNSLDLFLDEYDGNFTLIGSGWKINELKNKSKINYLGSLYGEKIYDFYRRAICCLGLLMESLDGVNEGDEVTIRSLFVPAYGGVLLHPRNPSSEKLYGSGNFCLYNNISEASEKANMLVSDPSLRLKVFKEQHEEVISKADYVEDFVSEIVKLSSEN